MTFFGDYLIFKTIFKEKKLTKTALSPDQDGGKLYIMMSSFLKNDR